MKDFTQKEFRANNGRVSNLILIYQSTQSAKRQGRRDAKSSDTLRAAVVLLHSALEEVFRNLFLWRLPSGSRESLNQIPLAGTPANQRAKAFLLGDLIPWDDRFVHNVIRESIDAYINQMNLNGIPDICSSLKMIDIESEQFRKYFPLLSESMKRRHQIVHQMDRSSPFRNAGSRTQSISVRQVKKWQDNTAAFVYALLDSIERPA